MLELVREILCMAVLRQLLEKLWFDIFFDMLNDQGKCLVKTASSNRTFCFGDGVEVKAINLVKFLVTIVGIKGVREYIEVDILKNDLLLLLSHKTMKTVGML